MHLNFILAMQPAMGVELCQKVSGFIEKSDGSKEKYQVGNIIMDGDTTTISHIRQKIDPDISVWANVGHAKKALKGHLLKIGAKHKQLSTTVKDYLTKCFGYVLSTNKGKPDEISNGCKGEYE